jgi:phage FluMu gp28-like protein
VIEETLRESSRTTAGLGDDVAESSMPGGAEHDPLEFLVTHDDPDAPPPVLLPYQQAWVADTATLKVMEKGRRTGITWAEAADDVLIASSVGGSKVFYISATQDMAREYIEACALWARAFNAAAAEIEEGLFDDTPDGTAERRVIKTFEINFPGSKNRIVALSSRPENLRGKQGVIVIDEAAFHGDLKKLLKAALAMLLWGDKIRIVSTHQGADNPFAELIEEIRASKRGKNASVHRVPFRDAVKQGLYQRVCMRRGIPWSQAVEDEWVADAYKLYGDDSAEELDVIPSQGSGTYLTMALIVARMSSETPLVRGRWNDEFGLLPDHVRELEVSAWCDEFLLPHLKNLDPMRVHGFGEDFGRVSDLTVDVVLEEGADLVNRCKLVVELSNCPFRQQEQILFYILDRLPRFRSGAMDAGGNGAALAEYAANRYGTQRVEQIKLNDSFYLQHMPKLKAGLQDATLTDLPRDDQLRDDLRALKVIDGVAKLPKTKTQRGDVDGPKLTRHGDFAIALFLAVYAMQREAGLIEWTGAARGNRDDPDADSDDFAVAQKGGW